MTRVLTDFARANSRVSEANTQAEFYHFARLLDLPVLLEVDTPAGRIDIAVLTTDRNGIVAVVECKRDGVLLSAESKPRTVGPRGGVRMRDKWVRPDRYHINY